MRISQLLRIGFAYAALVCGVSEASARMLLMASHYGGPKDHASQRTADGTPFRRGYDSGICAHRSWRFGTRLRLINPRNGRVAYCTVHDRGPFVQGRQLDIAYAAAVQLGMDGLGVLEVEILH
ncbi:MAG: septal ring lytic transglycosylase RlpA family lipoprotein [Patescibacteria group bacterium]|nr:septal ring lytic transglycosylase RlpA family lipoprotein [Patescibacteria group bacterium]